MTARTGLVSITLRKHTPEEIIDLVNQAGADVIEWGGDVHVPPGDTALAERVGQQTRDAGLAVSCYGSYYRLGLAGFDPGNGAAVYPEFPAVLDAAVALGAPMIRVWAGREASGQIEASARRRAEADALAIAEQAHAQGVGITYEYHTKTLTDEIDSACRLLAATDHPAVTTLWQPPNDQPEDYILRSLESVIPRLSNVHVFHWIFPGGQRERRPLAEGEARWRSYLEKLKPHGNRDYLIEFVHNDEPAQYLADAACLKQWLAAV